MFSPVVSLTTLNVEISDTQRIVFISDVHLGLGTLQEDRIREDRLLSLLRSLPGNTVHLFIVGDLFDYWFDYRSVIPRRHVRTLAALAELSSQGLPITYLMGNHDFGHYTYFHEELGITVEQGDVELHAVGKRLYVSHGDGKAANDKGYLVLRAVLRSRFAQWLYRKLHPDLGIRLAARTSHGSRQYTDARDYGSDGLRDFAAEKLAEGYHAVVMGHRHRASEEVIGSGLYVNLGDWLGNSITYGEFDASGRIALKHLPVYLPNTN